MSELCQQAERAGYIRGTACEQAVVKIFDAMETKFLPAVLLRELLLKDKHTKSTVQRAITRLVKHGNLTKHAGGELELVSRELPWIQSNASRPGGASNRFGGRANPERDARFVREYLIDRLDTVFENPNAFLVKVLKAVEWSGRAMTAIKSHDANGVKVAAEEFDAMHAGRLPMSAVELMQGLQVALFPEEFLEDEEVAAALESNRKQVVDEREKIIARIGEENEAIRRENLKITDENEVRVKNGCALLPMKPLAELPIREWRTKELANGLIPRGGGERVGAARLRAFLQVVGANKQETPDD